MNLQEYKQALKKQLLTFKWLDKGLIDEIVAECVFKEEYLLTCKPDSVVSGGFDWGMSTKGEEYWTNVHIYLSNGQNPHDKMFTQSEVQQLLHILRDQLDVVSFHKAMHKEDAAERWDYCDKKDKFTARSFAAYSEIYASYKQLKQEEKKLVNLITKLKGLK